ncbi:MAG TPA: Fic family protein [Aquella sp.]|nr:Fic family protein [Aquella sp.]
MTHQNKALWDAKKIIAQIVTDVVNLEDINYTVPEVQTLLDGITVGGHKIQDELITLNQIQAWKFLFDSIENNSFSVSRQFVLQLHDIVAHSEALVWGKFRDKNVYISGTDYIPPKSEGLDNIWNELEQETKSLLGSEQKTNSAANLKAANLYLAAINLFAKMARTQFFFDGNKRTARMMMSGLLLTNQYPMINVSATRKLEFNQTMIGYYNTKEVNYPDL